MSDLYTAVRCPCEHPGCTHWHVQWVANVQGVGFTEKQARAVASLLTALDAGFDVELELSRLHSAAQTLRRLDGDSALGRGCGLHDIAKKLDDVAANLSDFRNAVLEEAALLCDEAAKNYSKPPIDVSQVNVAGELARGIRKLKEISIG